VVLLHPATLTLRAGTAKPLEAIVYKRRPHILYPRHIMTVCHKQYRLVMRMRRTKTSKVTFIANANKLQLAALYKELTSS
jgi:hypothetical protein